MDPNVSLANIREMLEEYHRTGFVFHTDRLFDHIEDLDHWLSNGGFLPADWNHHHGFNAEGGFG